MAFEPTCTVQLDMAPVPRVEIVFTSVPAGTETATVYRIVDGVSSLVRGTLGVFAAGGFSAVDFEAPFLVDVEYRAECFEADGLTLGFTDGTTVRLELDATVFHNPLDPSTAIMVDPLPSFGADLSSPFDGELVQPSGRSRPVWVGFGRTGLRGVSLDVATDTTADAVTFAALFGSQGNELLPIVCVRTHPKWRLPLPLFAVIPSPREQRFDVQFGGQIRYWVLQGDEVASPAPNLAVGTLTYLDMENSYATYDDMEAAYLTYLDAESDFTLAGVS